MQNLSKTYRLYQLIKKLASILPKVCTNLFYHALKYWGLGVDFDYLFILCTVWLTLNNANKYMHIYIYIIYIIYNDVH